MKMLLARSLVIAIPVALAGCTVTPKVTVKSEAQYYQEANASLKSGNYTGAVTAFEALESLYPVGNYTEQAQLEVIYGKLMQADYLAAITAADRYLRLHPESARLDYVLYLRGLANYNADQDGLLKRLPINMAHRDLGQAKVAFDDFRQLISRYPNSPYVADARQRMIYLRNQLAESEMHVARYYQTRGAQVAVINRARWVVENYPESSAVPEALLLLATSYEAMGMKELAKQTQELLAANTQSSKPN